jgi:octaprenyl-diphosphate synthase
MAQIIAIVQQTGALQATRDAAAAEAQRALNALQALAQNPYSHALQQLASQLLERRF